MADRLHDYSRIPELAKSKGVEIKLKNPETVEFERNGGDPEELTVTINGITYDTEKSEIIDSWIVSDKREPDETWIARHDTFYEAETGEHLRVVGTFYDEERKRNFRVVESNSEIVHSECLYRTQEGAHFLEVESSILPGMESGVFCALIPLTNEEAEQWESDHADAVLIDLLTDDMKTGKPEVSH